MAKKWTNPIDFTPVIPPSADPITLAVVGILDIIGFLSFLFGNGVEDAIHALQRAMTGGFQMVDAQFLQMGEYASGLFRDIGKLLGALWNGVIVALLRKLYSVISKLHQWLEEKLAPILRFLTKVRAFIDRIFRAYIKPFLNMLQHVRQFLQILKAFGIKWAAQLDAKIAHIEATVAGLFLQVRSTLNGVIDLLNFIADPLGLVRRPTMVLSLRRTFNASVRAVTGLPPAMFWAGPQGNLLPGTRPLPLNFDPANILQNPPASAYMGADEGLGGFFGFTTAQIPDDTDADAADPLDYWDASQYPPVTCGNPTDCARVQWEQQLSTGFFERAS